MKLLNKLTLKNLRLNKVRTAVTIIGIMLSAALITVVSGMALSGRQTMIDGQKTWSGNYDVALDIMLLWQDSSIFIRRSMHLILSTPQKLIKSDRTVMLKMPSIKKGSDMPGQKMLTAKSAITAFLP